METVSPKDESLPTNPNAPGQRPDTTIDYIPAQANAVAEQPTLAPSATPPMSSEPADEKRTGCPSVQGYDILGVLGQGGMGIVYKARQLSLNRIVALKMILHAEHSGSEEQRRFRAEAEAVAQLQHPHIVQIYEVGEHNGLPYFSLEFCPGGSLAGKLDGKPLPAGEAARLVETLARAVQAAHLAGVVHRDIKPANVLLAADGTPKITDFGLAKRLNDSVRQTASGALLGTPAYMAPEQAEGRKRIGPTADVYALGAVLYEMLTGRPPFRGATPLDTILQVVSEDPTPPRQLNPEVPKDLEAICLKCLDKDPCRRYPVAADLARDLVCFLDGEPVAASQSGLLDLMTGAMDRVRLRAEFAEYGTLLLWFAPLMLLPEMWVTVGLTHQWSSHLIGLGRLGRLAGFLLLVGYYRGWSWWHRGSAERQLWSVWGGYLLACFVFGLSVKMVFGFDDAEVDLKFYQGWAVLTALAFFALAGNFWGYCAIIGVCFLALSLVMAADLMLAPLEFGFLWAVVLVLLGLRLRRMKAVALVESGK